MGNKQPRHLVSAKSSLKVEPLPTDLIRLVRNRFGDVCYKTIEAYIRHNYTNYEKILGESRLTQKGYQRFKDYTNSRVLRSYKKWQKNQHDHRD